MIMTPGRLMAPNNGISENGFNIPMIENEIENNEASDDGGHSKVGKPPRILPAMRHSISQALLLDASKLDSPPEAFGGTISSPRDDSQYLPVFRSGSYSEKGPKQAMEDEHIRVDNLQTYLGTATGVASPAAFYGVFDGHGGVDAATFTRKNILRFILEDSNFSTQVLKAVRNAFVRTDSALADNNSLDRTSGTTALTALIIGRTMLIANAGDSRAVLGKRGKAIDLSTDHKPNSTSEKLRIEELGGVIFDGYLDGQLSVARALGDWHLKGPKGSNNPLSSEPEMEEVTLTEEDEFMIIGCDGLWDVMSSQCAVTMVRKELKVHNDPERCSKVLVKEALRRNTCDNLTVLVVCFSTDPPPPFEIPRSNRRRSISAEGLDVLKCILANNP